VGAGLLQRAGVGLGVVAEQFARVELGAARFASRDFPVAQAGRTEVGPAGSAGVDFAGRDFETAEHQRERFGAMDLVKFPPFVPI
jgi:hypothetical protein